MCAKLYLSLQVLRVTKPMIKIMKQKIGQKMAIFLQSNSQEERRAWHTFYYNWGVAEGMKDMGGNTSYFLTTETRWNKGMGSNIWTHLIENGNAKSYKKNPQKLRHRAALAAAAKLAELQDVRILPVSEILNQN